MVGTRRGWKARQAVEASKRRFLVGFSKSGITFPKQLKIESIPSPDRTPATASMSSVYDRLTDPKGYTGVYAKRFEGDGRINHHTDQSMSNGKQARARFPNERILRLRNVSTAH